MAKKLHLRIPLFSTRATATVSVALVLVILGLATMVGLAAHRLTDSVRENMGFIVVFEDDVTASQVAQVTDRLRSEGGVGEVVYSSPEVILDRWQKMVGEDEDIMRLAGVNPFSPELEVKVTPQYASADSISVLSGPVALMPFVRDVKISIDIIDSVNHTMRSVSLTLLIIAVALLVVSFVLIFNTVRLTVYSRRFLINTMQLVGATRGFIRRPFLKENAVTGLVAGVLAALILAAMLVGAIHLDPQIQAVVQWADAALVMAGMVVTGMIICLLASIFACNRYLSLSYDQLFR